MTIKIMGTDPSLGSRLDIALQCAHDYGICEDTYFPNDTSLDVKTYTDAALISQEATNNALNYRIDKYHFLNALDEGSLKQAMSQYGLVLYGMDVSDEWWTSTTGQTSWLAKDILPIRPPTNGLKDPTLSRHLILGSGYDATPFDYFRNSFGPTWGDAGDGYFGTDDVAFVYEAAVISNLQDPIIEKAVQIEQTIEQVQQTENTIRDPQVKASFAQLVANLFVQLFALFK